MKRLLFTVMGALTCVAAFGQGKIGFANDSVHLVYWNPVLVPRMGGTAVYAGNMPPGVTLVTDLYMGTSSSSLSFYSSTTFSNVSPGKWDRLNVQAINPFIPGGTTVFVVAQVRNSSSPAEATLDATQLDNNPYGLGATLGFFYFGWSSEFQFTLGSSITYPPMYIAPGWAVGTYDLSASAGAGARGAIIIPPIPEPSTFGLAGLGIVGMLLFRRRREKLKLLICS